MRVAASIGVLVWLVVAPAPRTAASADDDEVNRTAAIDAAELDPRTADVAWRLWRKIECLCGRCQRMTLARCRCRDAATERSKLLEMLRGRDVTASAADATYQAILRTYRPQAPGRAASPPAGSEGKIIETSTFLGALVIIASACAAFVLIELRRLRRRPSPARRRR